MSLETICISLYDGGKFLTYAYLTRVPCVGECIRQDNDALYKVLSVEHIAKNSAVGVTRRGECEVKVLQPPVKTEAVGYGPDT